MYLCAVFPLFVELYIRQNVCSGRKNNFKMPLHRAVVTDTVAWASRAELGRTSSNFTVARLSYAIFLPKRKLNVHVSRGHSVAVPNLNSAFGCE